MKNLKKSLEKLKNAIGQSGPMGSGPGACCYMRNGQLLCGDTFMPNDCAGVNGVHYPGQRCRPGLCQINKPKTSDLL